MFIRSKYHLCNSCLKKNEVYLNLNKQIISQFKLGGVNCDWLIAHCSCDSSPCYPWNPYREVTSEVAVVVSLGSWRHVGCRFTAATAC